MAIDFETFALFEASNFDVYDSGSERCPAVLKAGVAQYGLELSDVLAVTQDLGLWAICTVGVFRGDLRGMFKKRVEVGELIPYSEVNSIRVESSGPHSKRIVLIGHDGKALTRIDFGAGGPGNSPAQAAAYCDHVFMALQQASAGR
jgi:hypothetical protein